MEDTKLLRLLHKDPNAGMEQLMNQYAGLVYAVVRGRLADSLYVSSDIEDCVADTFSEFFLDLQKYDPKISSIRSYLCVLARNNATDLLRKRKKQTMSVPSWQGRCLTRRSTMSSCWVIPSGGTLNPWL